MTIEFNFISEYTVLLALFLLLNYFLKAALFALAYKLAIRK